MSVAAVGRREGRAPMRTVGSVVARRQLGRELRTLREKFGRTREDVGAMGIASLAKLARIEQGQTSIRPGDARELCLLYGADEDTTERMVEMARGTRATEWWESQNTKTPRWFGMYLSLEEVAQTIHVYEPALVHGLLQTKEYAKAVGHAIALDPDLLTDGYLNTRLLRQEKIFSREEPLCIDLVLGEAALRVECEDPTVMTAQVEHLRSLVARPEIDVRVVPQARGLHPGVYGQFTILDFAEGEDPTVVYIETYEAARYPEIPDQVARFRRRFQTLRATAVPLEEFEL
jgi:transcriptional regulator with XRE-family HTH domain